MQRRTFLIVAGASACAAHAPQALAQAFSGKSIRLIVPFPAGGPTDIVARPLAQLLADALDANVVVENRGGAGGSVGAESVAKAPPDGLTLLMGTVGTHAINAALYRKLGYDAVRDFTPIALVAAAPVAIVAHPAQPMDSVASLIALARRMPGRLSYGTAGNGTPGHLTAVMFKAASGIELTHVPYRGSAPAVTDLLGGQVQSMFDNAPSAMPHIQAGRLRPIAITSPQRSPLLPDVPTVAESGHAGFDVQSWFGLALPHGTPQPIVDKLNTELNKVLALPDVKKRLAELGATPAGGTPADMRAFIAAEIKRWNAVVKASGAKAE
jgi:tripartite-type tricarboxylate transporter receptor subunit TctC